MPDERNDVAPAEQALLDAITADPKSDAPRLAYAEWVAPYDPELAEFIRLDCEHIRDSPPGTLRRKGPRLAELERKVSSALSRKGFQPAFVRRGFVEGGIVSSDALIERADVLFDRAPALRELTLRPKSEHLAALSRLPHFVQLTSLKIEVSNQVVPYSDGRRKPRSASDALDDEALALFVASPHLRSVETLSFACASVGPATARALAESTALVSLRSLGIEDDTRFDAAAANALAAWPARGALTSIRIKFSNLGPEGCTALAASHLFDSVAALTLEGAGIGPGGARALGMAGSLARCGQLRLKNNALLDEGAKALAEGSALAGLATLDLAKNRIGDAGAIALAGLPGLAGLRDLDLTDNVVSNQGAIAFANSPHLHRLERLALNQNAIAEAGAEALAATQCLPALTALGLDHNAIFSDETEQWTDWNGTPVGSGPVRLSWSELQRRYGARFRLF